MRRNVKQRMEAIDQKIADQTPNPIKRKKSSYFSLPSIIGAIITLLIGLLWSPIAKFIPFSPIISHHYNALAPSRFPTLSSLPQFSSSNHTSSLLWGTYRPGFYFGIRTRLPKSLIAGLMWADLDPSSPQHWSQLRHEALQSHGLSTYGWTRHDGRSFAEQNILDNRLNITTQWSKSMQYHSDWGAHIHMTSSSRGGGSDTSGSDDVNDDGRATMFFYFANEDGSPIHLEKPERNNADDNKKASSEVQGESTGIGQWRAVMQFTSTTSTNNNDIQVNYLGLKTPHLHNLTDTVNYMLQYSIWQQRKQQGGSIHIRDIVPVLPNHIMPGSNVVLVQVTAAVPGSVSLHVAFTSSSISSSNSNTRNSRIERVESVSGDHFSQLMEERRRQFDTHFEAAFPTTTTTSTSSTQSSSLKEQQQKDVAKKALSNMLGGIGYWYGHSLAKSPSSLSTSTTSTTSATITPLWNTAFYSAVPSRSFFPRGFLWDEGFHQLLIRRYDAAISRDILAHWLDLQTESGWIPREVILGEEAKSRVPSEFIVQSTDAANPPTLFLVLSEMARNALSMNNNTNSNSNGGEGEAMEEEERRKDREFLIAAWPRLKAWHTWYMTTQSGKVDGSFRWRGRGGSSSSSTRDTTSEEEKELNPKTLTSGLDDFPRASHPNEEERHVDLRCWMALATRAMANIGTMVLMDSNGSSSSSNNDEQKDVSAAAAAEAIKNQVQRYEELASKYEDFESLNALHYDISSGQYRDWGLHTESVRLVNKVVTSNDGTIASTITVRQVDEPPSWQYIPHYGYISLFPLLMKLIPKDSPILKQQLELLRKEELLWTGEGHGLRSLAKNSSLYMKYNTEHDPPYWRGAVWINMNYLAVDALRYYAEEDKGEGERGPYADMAEELARELRSALVDTIVGEYTRTGYMWENYGDEDGRGKGSHPFTGWTALVALM